MSRKNRLYLRLSDDELALIKERAEEAGMSPARYSRERVLGVYLSRGDDLDRRHLVKIGNNMNQIARHLNSNVGRKNYVAEVAQDLTQNLIDLRGAIAARQRNVDDHSED